MKIHDIYENGNLWEAMKSMKIQTVLHTVLRSNIDRWIQIYTESVTLHLYKYKRNVCPGSYNKNPEEEEEEVDVDEKK